MKQILGLWILKYLRFFARLQLAKNKEAVIIGITGSSGKTSTRLALVEILKVRGLVKHSAHANSESGIPLNILGLKMSNYSVFAWLKVLVLAPWRYLTFAEKYNYYVVEMGIDGPNPPKNMDYLLTIIQPDMAIILGASLTHAAAFDHLVKDTNPARKSAKLLKLIASEKMKLAHAVSPKGTVVINDDNAALRPHTHHVKARLLRVGHTSKSDFKIKKTSISAKGFNSRWSYLDNTYLLQLSDLFGEEYATTFLSAIAIGHSLGISLDRCCEALQAYRAPAGRMRVFSGIKNTHIIDSSYNASPATMLMSLNNLKKIAPRSQKVAVLGDMRELGILSKVAHQNLAKQLPQYADLVFLFGPLMKKYVVPTLKRQRFPVYHVDTMTELIRQIKAKLMTNSWVLVKGSQNGLYLERVVESLLQHPEDVTKLCRRGKYWDKIRSATP